MASSSSNKSSIRSVPIPSYAKEWGNNVKRPLEAPSDLDAGHIALQDIFLRETADGSEEFVVLEGCNRCRALELKCDHSLRCSGCKNFGTSCARKDLSCRPLQAILSRQANLPSPVSTGSVPNLNAANGKGKGTGKARSTDVLQLAPPDVASYGKDRKPLQLAPPGYRSPYYRPRLSNPLPNPLPATPENASTSKSTTPPSKRPITPKLSSSNVASQASASSHTVSPASSMEIPDYAKAWSPKVRRPEKLPVNHDPHRIAAEDVFSIERSDGLTQLVVLQRCDRCRELRQHCNRAWPSCSRCKSSKLECNHSDMSYVPLPHGYVPRGVPSTGGNKADSKARAKASKEGTASMSVNDEPMEAQTPNADIVSTNKRRQPDEETKTEEDPGVVSTTRTSPPKTIDIQRTEDTETPNKRRKLDAEGTSGSKLSSRPVKKSATEPSVLYKWDRETTPKVNWTVPQHPPITSQLPKNADYRRQPMVWASSLEEFTAVLPEFARLTNNVSLYSSVSPTVVLDEKSWPEDRWEGNVITINFVRQFSVPVSSDPRNGKMPDGLALMDGKESRVIEPHPPLKSTPSVTVPHLDTKSDRPIKSETPNLGSSKDKQPPTPLKNGVESSSKGTGQGEATPKPPSSNANELTSGANETSKPKQSPTPSNPAHEASKEVERPAAGSSQDGANGNLPPDLCLCSDYRYDPSCKRCHPQPPKPKDGSSDLPKSATNETESSAAPTPPELKVDDPHAPTIHLPNGLQDAERASTKSEIPEPYPEEIVALQYTFNNGIPMKLVASSFCPLLPVAFDSKIKFGFLGFFHITGAHVHVDSVKLVQHRGKPQKRGRVTWRFTFEWIPGGVPPLLSNLSGFNGDAPWWDMSQTEIFPAPVAFTKRPDRFYPDELGYCLVPEHVLSDCGRGWLHICGRLNVRGWRGSRRCDNCKMGYYAPGLAPIKEASEVRDSWRFSPLLDPETKCPNGLTETVSVWNTGMRTLRYSVASGRPQDAIATHVFNCNLPALEKDADIIFKKFQGVFMEVVLDRPRARGIAPTTPRYRYTVGIPKRPRQSGQDSLVIDGPLKVQAGPAPDAITIFPPTRDMMLSLAKTYVGGIPGHELPGLEINWIEATGWLEESKTKVPGIAHAADAPVLFVCLGADIELIFDWKLAKRVKASGLPAKAPAKRRGATDKATKANGTTKAGAGSQPVANSSVDGDGDTKMHSGTADDGEGNSDVDEEDGAGGDEDSGPISKTKSSAAKDTLHIMMTHGDLVMVTGGDLHYGILPRGYCILLKTIG